MMINSPSFILVPAGELSSSPHWQSVLRLRDGHKILGIAMLLRDMAVLCNSGGDICHPNGRLLSTSELAGVLGVDFPWLEQVLHDVLAPIGIVAVDADGDGWTSTDPVFQGHLQRLHRKDCDGQQPPPLELEEGFQGETQVARAKRLSKNRKRAHDYRKRWGLGEPVTIWVPGTNVTTSATTALPETVTAGVTRQMKVSEIQEESQALPYSIKDDGIGKETAADATHAAVASTPTALSHDNPLSLCVESAIQGLPLHAQPGIRALCREESKFSEEIVVSNLRLLGDRLTSKTGKPITNYGGWLRRALRGDYACAEREVEAEKKRKAEETAKKNRELAEREKERALAAIRRQAELLVAIDGLDSSSKDEIYRDARQICEKVLGRTDQHWVESKAVEIYLAKAAHAAQKEQDEAQVAQMDAMWESLPHERREEYRLVAHADLPEDLAKPACVDVIAKVLAWEAMRAEMPANVG